MGGGGGGRGKEGAREETCDDAKQWRFCGARRLHDSVDGTRWIHVLSLPPHYSGHCKKHIFQ